MSAGILGSPPFAAPTGPVQPALSRVAGNPNPLTPKAGPVRQGNAELASMASSHDLIPVPPGGGLISSYADLLASLDLIHGMDELIGRTEMQLGPAMSRAYGRGRPGDISTAEACGRLSGPLHA